MDVKLIDMNTNILINILTVDQQAIKDYKSGKISASDLSNINSDNVITVKRIIAEMGFPTINLTSEKAYKAAILVILHSNDLELLDQSIKYLQNADPTSIQRRDIAYMIDKIRVIKKLPQLYGTQYNINKEGIPDYIDIEKPEEIEMRRAEYGMESFDEYKKIVEQNLTKSS